MPRTTERAVVAAICRGCSHYLQQSESLGLPVEYLTLVIAPAHLITMTIPCTEQ